MSSKELHSDPVTAPGASNGTVLPLRAFFGHHKCATGWIDDILREICLHMGIHFKIVHLPEHFLDVGSLGNLVREQHVDFVAYTNADRTYLEDLPLHRGFHVIRDPRDVVVSAYFSHLKSLKAPNWDTLKVLRDNLATMSKDEGLFYEMEYLKEQFEQMYDWDYGQEDVLEVKMENLTKCPVDGFTEVIQFLGLLDESEREGATEWWHSVILKMNRLNHKGRRFMPGNVPMFPVPKRRLHGIPARAIEAIVQNKSFAKLAGGRKQGQEDVTSHYRKGTPGDWKNHFSAEHTRYFKDHYGELLIKLGYETSLDW